MKLDRRPAGCSLAVVHSPGTDLIGGPRRGQQVVPYNGNGALPHLSVLTKSAKPDAANANEKHLTTFDGRLPVASARAPHLEGDRAFNYLVY